MSDGVLKLLLEIGQFAGVIVLGIGIYLSSRLKTHFEKKQLFDPRKSLNKNLRVQATLQEIRGVFDADRVCLYQFHNGNYYVSGESIQKLSLTHVVCRRGVSHPENVSTIHQNIPISCLLKTIDAITSKSVAVSDGEYWDDSYFKDLMRHSGTSKFAICAVKTSANQYYGMIVVGWLSDQIDIPMDKITDLIHSAQELAIELVYNSK